MMSWFLAMWQTAAAETRVIVLPEVTMIFLRWVNLGIHFSTTSVQIASRRDIAIIKQRSVRNAVHIPILSYVQIADGKVKKETGHNEIRTYP